MFESTYRTVELLSKKYLHVNLIVLSDDARAGSDEVAGRLSGLNLENNGDVALVDQSCVSFGSVLLPWHEAEVWDGIQSD